MNLTIEEAIARIKDHKIVHKMNESRAIYISEALDMKIKSLEQELNEQWKQLKDTIVEIRNNNEFENEDVTLMCRFLVNYMETLEKQMQEPCGDVVSRQWLMECVNEGWIKFDTEKDKNKFIHLVRDMTPPVTSQSKSEDIAKAFQLGVALGFGKKYDEMNKIIDEIKKVSTPQPKTGHWIEENINE